MLIILKYVLYAKMKYQFLRQFQYVALTGLEFTVEIQLASNSRDFTCVCLPTCVCQGVYTTPTGKYPASTQLSPHLRLHSEGNGNRGRGF